MCKAQGGGLCSQEGRTGPAVGSLASSRYYSSDARGHTSPEPGHLDSLGRLTPLQGVLEDREGDPCTPSLSTRTSLSPRPQNLRLSNLLVEAGTRPVSEPTPPVAEPAWWRGGSRCTEKREEETLEEALRSAAFTQVTRGGPGRTQEDGPPPAGVGARVGAPPLAPGKASQLRTAPRARHGPASPPLTHPSQPLASPSHCPPNSRGAAPLPAPPCSPPWGPSPATPDPSVGPSVSAERPAPGRPSREARPRAHPSTRVRGPGGPGGTARATPRPAEPCGPGASADPPCKAGSAL